MKTPSCIEFIERVLVNPETSAPFVLTDAERSFLSHAFELNSNGRMKYPELLFSAPKKSGKTTLAAMIVLYAVVVLGGKYGEAYIVANDLEQSIGRVFTAIKRIVSASPILSRDACVFNKKIEFLPTGASISAIASDAAGAAGSNLTVAAFDELWGYTSEASHRLFDECVPGIRFA